MTTENVNFTKTVTLTSANQAIATQIFILDEEHVKVTRVRSGAKSVLTKDADPGYTVTDVSVEGGCTVTTVNQAIGDIITITLNIPFTQTGDYVANEAFPPEVNEAGHDLRVMLMRQLKEIIDRCVKFPEEDSGQNYGQEIPSIQNRIGMSPSIDTDGNLVWSDANGSGLASFGNAAIVSVPIISPSVNVIRVFVPTDQTAHLTLSLAIEGRSYARILEFCLINDGDVLKIEDGMEKEYLANAIGGESCTATCVVSGTSFLVTINGAGLTDNRNIHFRWKIETFNNNASITYTVL